jgi:uncharacterized protein (TIGR00266 family)
MDIEVKYRPVNSIACVRLEAGEKVVAEPSAMIGMSTNVNMETGMRESSKSKGGGLLGKIASAATSMLGGESFFTNTFTANGSGEVLLAPALSGDIIVEDVPQGGITMQSGAYIANTPGLDVEAKLGGTSTFFGGEGMFVLEATATGPGQQVVIGAFGGIEEMEVDGSMVIDNGHLVAWDSGLQLSLKKAASGWIGSFLSGEGKVFEINGQGRVWIQTRQPIEFGRAVAGLLPPRQ